MHALQLKSVHNRHTQSSICFVPTRQSKINNNFIYFKEVLKLVSFVRNSSYLVIDKGSASGC